MWVDLCKFKTMLSSDQLYQFSSVAQSCLTLCDPMDCNTPGFPVLHQLLELAQIHVHRVGDAIQPTHPVLSPLLLPSIFPSIRVFSNESVLRSGDQSIGASVSASVLPMNIQHWFPLRLVGSPCSPRDSQESSPTPTPTPTQFKSISSSVLSLLYGPSLTSIHDYWKTIVLTRCSFVCKVMSLLFNMLARFVKDFLPRTKHLFNFKAPITICSDFTAQDNKVSHCFHCFPIYLPWSDGTRCCHGFSFLNGEF